MIKQVDKQNFIVNVDSTNKSPCLTISTKLSLLKQLSLYVPLRIQKLFYQGYILPLIDYGASTLGTTSKQNIERLARITLKADYNTPSSEMFNELGLSSIRNHHSYNKVEL